jgi:hypothetical protein
MNDYVWNREKLYGEVWEQPLIKLAKEYGISAVALGKVCRKLKIPLPGRGYWARMKFGKLVKRTPLPEFKNPPFVRRLKHQPAPKPDADVSDPELLRIAELEQRPITIPAEGSEHKLITATTRVLKKARPGEKPILERPANQVCFDVRVSKESLDRALRVMCALLIALEAEGFKVSIDASRRESTSAKIYGQDVRFAVTEDLKVKERREVKEYYGTKMVPTYEPTGNLAFQIWSYGEGLRKRWADGKTQKLENLLPQCLGGLIRVGRGLRIRAEEIRERELRWARERQEREDLALKIKEEEGRVQNLETWAENWVKAQRIRDFVSAFEKSCVANGETITAESKNGEWMLWGRQQADRIDPLVESPPSILDRKKELPRW